VTARQPDILGGNQPIGERAEEIATVVQPRPLAPQQDLQELGEHATGRRHQRQQQSAARITRRQPDPEANQQPDREVARRPEHPPEIVIVDPRRDEVVPRPAVAEECDGNGRDGNEEHPEGWTHSSSKVVSR